MGRSYLSPKEQFLLPTALSLKLNLKNSIFATREIKYLWYNISVWSINPGEEKTQAVKEFPVPKRVKEILRFIRLTNWFRAFILGYAKQEN